ncbi:MAG: hypothetical protein JRH11_04700 [Deltaproteobacteria bacterium]|nr:hypothetical protein [Deltaproteobacteria bacterium]
MGALCLAEAGHRPVAVGLGHPQAPGARRVRRRLGALGTLVLGRPDLTDEGVRRTLESARPDVVLSWFWPRRIPPEVLALGRAGAFGVHPSLLPRWRGPDPYFWALRAGDQETGVTLHRLTATYDTGDIIAQIPVSIGDDDAWSLARRLDRPSLGLLVETAERLVTGDPMEGRHQDEGGATSAPFPSPEQLAIDWRQEVTAILRLVRAAGPHPGATADFGGHEVEVVGAERYGDELPRALAVAEARCVDRGVVVRASDDGVLVTAARADGQSLEGRALHRLFEEL